MKRQDERRIFGGRYYSDQPLFSGCEVFSCIIIFMFFSMVACNVLTSGTAFGNLFFYDRSDTAMDFFNSVIYASSRTPYSQYSVVYPPLANLFFYIFAHCAPKSVRLQWADSYEGSILMRGTALDLRTSQYTLLPFILFVVFITLVFYAIAKYSLKGTEREKRLYAIALLCSTAFLLSLEHGNIVILAAILSCFFICYKDSKSPVVSELALISLAIAAGIKLYPAFFGVLLIVDKQYKKAFRAVIYGLICFILPFYFFEGTEAIGLFLRKVLAFSDASSKASISGFSLQQIVKPWLAIFAVENWTPFIKLAKLGGYAVLLVSFLVLPFVSRWKAIGLLTMAMYMFPGKISSGTIIYIMIPLGFFLSEFRNMKRIKWLYFILYLLLLAPIPLPTVSYFKSLATGYSMNLFIMQVAELLLLATYFLDCISECISKGAAARSRKKTNRGDHKRK